MSDVKNEVNKQTAVSYTHLKCIKLPVLQYMEFVTEEWEGLQREHHTLCD